ncbi:cytochrome P450 [Suillus paluster]|uniref:cytochrome P450 n=1 Tax=Suillus paluster TaxID=48578 RepID=UPI001B86900D|nr:cytochrome P450 [Suillus paluster]KAG1742265.1 cytochrome P450 [Suillus paluster]
MKISTTLSILPGSSSSLWTTVHSVGTFNVACSFAALWAFVKVLRALRWRLKTTQLRGPPRSSIVYGVSNDLVSSTDTAAMYERWADEYGVVYMIPSVLGQTKIVLCDPKAIAHFYARETWTYVQTPLASVFLEGFIGRGLLWAHGESHRRQRKALTPAFSNAAIRKLTTVFYDSAYKVKGAWDTSIESSKDGNAVIEVQNCLDTIGIAGFSHDFGSLDGKHATVTEVFDTFGNDSQASAVNKVFILLAEVFPTIVKIPTKRTILTKKLGVTMSEISNKLLIRSRQEKGANINEAEEENPFIYVTTTVKAEGQDAELRLSEEEVVAQVRGDYSSDEFQANVMQMKVLLVAGYETTSVSLTYSWNHQWALIELSRHLDVQTRLREELLAFGADPTYDQLKANLPFLDAVVHEILRLHPPISEFVRLAAADDVIPLGEPVRTASGKMTDSISVAKGSLITISAGAINRSFSIWGPDAKEFKPDRWLTEGGISGRPRKSKTVLSVLVKNFMFEMRDGPDTQLEIARGILPRPRVVGEDGTGVPLRVRRYE